MRVAREKYFVCVWFIACVLNCDSLWLIAVVNYLNHANDLLWSFAPNQTNDTLGRPFGWYLLPLTPISRVVVIYMIFMLMNFSLLGIWVVYHYPETIKHYYFLSKPFIVVFLRRFASIWLLRDQTNILLNHWIQLFRV